MLGGGGGIMDNRIKEIIENIQNLEDELEAEFEKRGDDLRAKFTSLNEELLVKQHQVKIGVLRYIKDANILFILTSPIIYSLIVAFVLLDIMVSIYQAICFPIYKIKKVKRKDYMVFDRSKLAYLNIIEKLNCTYCSYGNGVIAYAHEVAARTEKFWCPIKHSLRIRGAHKYYREFENYGDGEEYHKRLNEHQKELEGNDKGE